MINLTRLEGENEYQYIWRIAKYVENGRLTWQGLADAVNREFRCDESEYRCESAYRKPYQGAKAYYENVFREQDIEARTRVLTVSDFHTPYHKPIEVFEKYKGKVDVLVINGDVQDCQSLSSFPKNYRENFMEEMRQTRILLIGLIEYIHPKKVIVNYGNHDERLGAYLAKNLGDDVIRLMPDTPLESIIEDGYTDYDKQAGTKTFYKPLREVFDDIEIEYTHNWWCSVGKAVFCHPKAFSNAMMKTAENAMQFFRNEGLDFECLVMAHTHRIGSYKIGKTIIFEQGCCCDTKKLRYGDGKLTKAQQEGYLYLCLDDEGGLIKDKVKQEYLN